ncbi:SAM-dependent methyltransferase [Streptomyces sp. NPDC096311]|uniref:SAM-dependent methyltransferase n=1 Tax=Streptomyces sp. NPDC096311 TaxID=3366083 RepID=UPI0037F409B5
MLAHARALLTGTPEGATDHLDAGVHDPGAVMRSVAGTLDVRDPAGHRPWPRGDHHLRRGPGPPRSGSRLLRTVALHGRRRRRPWRAFWPGRTAPRNVTRHGDSR